jgi:hypothetical protein
MSKNSVTASLIVRDEEDFIGGCLDTLVALVDDIVIVDTGSRDATIDIVKSFGGRLFHYGWQDDFSAARNHGLEQCRTDWVLYIDADERLRSGTEQPIRDLLDERWVAADVRFQPKKNFTRYKLTRLFRSDSRLRFRGAIHETILPSLELMTGGEPGAIGLTSLNIDHLGYDGDISSKHSRNLPLLERCVEEYPDRVFYWFHLTETLLGLRRFVEAQAVGGRGIALAETQRSEKACADGTMICQMLASAMLDRGTDPDLILCKGLRLDPSNHGLILTRAQRDLQFGSPLQALAAARDLQRVDPDSLPLGLIAYDRDIFGRLAMEIEIAALAKLGRKQEAALLIAANAQRLAV